MGHVRARRRGDAVQPRDRRRVAVPALGEAAVYHARRRPRQRSTRVAREHLNRVVPGAVRVRLARLRDRPGHRDRARDGRVADYV
eukprot:27746-Pelagococcus_subviridis.AAC.2